MKCISLTGRGTQCSRNAVINGQCNQHYHLHNLNVNYSDEDREIQFQRILERFGNHWYIVLTQEMIAPFRDLSIDYYKKEFTNIIVNHRSLFDDTVLEDINSTDNISEISEAVKRSLHRWYIDRQRENEMDTLNNIKYIICTKEVVKIFAYRKIQNNNNIEDALDIYKQAERCLIRKKTEWRDENIQKLRLKEVSKCDVMCDDVFKHVFVQYF